MDDPETLNRRARLRELIQFAFDGQLVKLINHIEKQTGKKPNQGELSGLRKDNSPSKSFGDKKAKTLTEQIGLHRRWFDMPLGSNLERPRWLDAPDAEAESGLNRQAANEKRTAEYLGLSEEERLLIRAYREAGSAERSVILRAAGVHLLPSSDMRTASNPLKSLAGSFSGSGADEIATEVVGGAKNSPRKRAREGGR
jgi:hypothetical protein